MKPDDLPEYASRLRSIAVAVPLKNEAAHVTAMLAALDEAAGRYGGSVSVVVLANDCTDDSLSLLEAFLPRHIDLEWRAVSMLPGARHAGWARRLALDTAAARLRHPDDLLLSTDADTLVDPNWIARTVAHVDRGYDAVAGHALTTREDRRSLGGRAKERLDRIGRYYTALAYLRAGDGSAAGDAWPRHFYEGGASIALTLDLYRRIGGAPTPHVAEDRALFDRIRAHGGRIRHPVDVRVFTSCRTKGRAPGGMADAVALWISRGEDEPLHELYGVSASLDGTAAERDRLCFRTLPTAHAEAQRLIRARRRARRDPSEAPPQIEPILFMSLGMDVGNGAPQYGSQAGHGVVATQRIVGLAEPVDQQEEAA